MNTDAIDASDGAPQKRVPPHDLDAEAAVLSAVLLDRDALDRVIDSLTPEHFYAERHRRIYGAILDLDAKGIAIDLVTLKAALADADRLQQIGGAAYLGQLIDSTPSVLHVEDHARRVIELHRKRRMIEVCQRIAAEGFGETGPADAWLQEAEQRVYAAASAGTSDETASEVHEIVSATWQDIEHRRDGEAVPGVPTGFASVDRILGGWTRGEVHVLAARPGNGKTAFALQAGAKVATAGTGVVFFSCEMRRRQLGERLIAQASGADLRDLARGNLDSARWSKVAAAVDRLSQIPMVIDDRPGQTLASIRSGIRRHAAKLRRHRQDLGLGLVIVDYLQLLRGERRKGDTRENEVSELSRGLKLIAGEYDVPLLLLSQLNREIERREDKRPKLSDLRDSGAIEQDAYAVLFLYREDVYRPDPRQHDGLAELIVAKHRNGPTGTLGFRFTERSTRFDETDDEITEWRHRAAGDR